MAKPNKVEAVAEIADKFRSSSAAVITEYSGLTVSQITTLRRSLGTGASYRVAKNTLVKRAAADAGVQGLEDLFVGPTAIAFVTGEPVDAAKALRDFAKDNKGLVIKGGYMDGRPLTVDEVTKIADLESREVLLAKLAGARGAKRLTADVSDSAQDFFRKRGFTAQQRNTVLRGGEWLANTTMEKPLASGRGAA